jgi:hypothetical protein
VFASFRLELGLHFPFLLFFVWQLMRKPLLEVAKTGNFPMSEETVTNIFTGDFTGIMRVNFTLLAGLVERLGSWSDTQVLGDVLLALVRDVLLSSFVFED